METYSIPVTNPVNYHLTGKFEALSQDWKHAELFLYDYELFVVTKGVLYLEYNNNRYHIEEGEMLLLPPVPPPHNLRRGFQSSDCAFYWMHFEHEKTDTGEFIKIPEYCRLHNPKKITILMKQLQDSLRSSYSRISLNYMTTAVLCAVYEDVSNTACEDNSVSPSKKQIYEDIIDYVKHNIHEKITVKKIAEHFGYNEKYISQLFASVAKITLKQFILEQKAEMASFFLTDTSLSIEEIAAALGYSDSHNFTRSYKHATGFTPTGYRSAFAKKIINH